MDKWLWAARFFKTRALAARACELGRIQSNGQQAKSGREVRVGDQLRVTNDGGDFQIEVLLLSEVRGPASVAQTLYCETAESRDTPEAGRGAESGCASSKRCRKAGHRNATGGKSSNFRSDSFRRGE